MFSKCVSSSIFTPRSCSRLVQNGIACLTLLCRRDINQVLSWSDESGRSGLDNVLQLVAKLLQSPDESGGLVIGDLIIHMIRRAGDAVLPVLPQMLQSMVGRMVTAKTVTFIQVYSLSLCFFVLNETESCMVHDRVSSSPSRTSSTLCRTKFSDCSNRRTSMAAPGWTSSCRHGARTQRRSRDSGLRALARSLWRSSILMGDPVSLDSWSRAITLLRRRLRMVSYLLDHFPCLQPLYPLAAVRVVRTVQLS